MRLDEITIRITIGGRGVAPWRVRLLGRLARWLGVPVDVAAE